MTLAISKRTIRKPKPFTFQGLRQLSKNMPEAAQTIDSGFHPDVLGVVATAYAVPQHFIQGVVKVPDGTLDRRRKTGVLNDTESDTVLRLAGLFDFAANVLGGDEQAPTLAHQKTVCVRKRHSPRVCQDKCGQRLCTFCSKCA